VLHVGNVANNAYLNARLLNAAGVESDVLCYGNYHFMASPEWEELDGGAVGIDPERPDWRRVAAETFPRPRWFSQGPYRLAAAYLEARRQGREWLSACLWRLLEARRRAVAGTAGRSMRILLRQSDTGTNAGQAPARAAASKHDSSGDCAIYGASRGWCVEGLRRLFSHYDIVHGYGAEPILPFVCGVRPYVAWEHGTLRHLPFQATPEGRLTARAYAAADAVVITNADNRAAAERLGISRYRFIPHPVSESRPTEDSVEALRRALRERLDSEFLVFHPSRQHWGADRHPHFEKGNDRFFEGLAELCRARPRAGAVCVAWGTTLDASRDLIRRLGLSERVLWIEPQTGTGMARHMLACDVMADQFFLGAFGSTLPRALGLGCASLVHLEEAFHAWCLPEPPPVIRAGSAGEIAAGLLRAYDAPDWRRELGRRGRQWYETYHSAALVRDRLVELYAELVSA